MLRSVLVGVDGSPGGDAALELALRWARPSAALVVGLGVVDVPAIFRPEPVPIGASSFTELIHVARLARARRGVEQYMARFTLRCAEAGVAHKLLEEEGQPAELILAEAQRCDLVLLGRETHFRFATQVAPCDTLTRVLRAAPRPVVAVPARLGGGTSVVVAYDGNPRAARALQAFQASGLAGSRKVHILSVGNDHQETARNAARAAEYLASHSVLATPHVLTPAVPVADVVLRQARGLNAEFVVMGCYARPALLEYFMGSVTRTVLRGTSVPLFLYR
jgi:nucleotide-binding universal stress UspA family protein